MMELVDLSSFAGHASPAYRGKTQNLVAASSYLVQYQKMYYVYVIKSINSDYTYTWMTNDIKRRLDEHNHWKTKSNKKYAPFTLIYSEKVENSIEARKRELFLKWGNWRNRLKNKLK